jgi:hypothetical protein
MMTLNFSSSFSSPKAQVQSASSRMAIQRHLSTHILRTRSKPRQLQEEEEVHCLDKWVSGEEGSNPDRWQTFTHLFHKKTSGILPRRINLKGLSYLKRREGGVRLWENSKEALKKDSLRSMISTIIRKRRPRICYIESRDSWFKRRKRDMRTRISSR